MSVASRVRINQLDRLSALRNSEYITTMGHHLERRYAETRKMSPRKMLIYDNIYFQSNQNCDIKNIRHNQKDLGKSFHSYKTIRKWKFYERSILSYLFLIYSILLINLHLLFLSSGQNRSGTVSNISKFSTLHANRAYSWRQLIPDGLCTTKLKWSVQICLKI